MPFDENDKEKVVESLSAIRRSGQKLEIALRFQQKQAEAEDVQKKNKVLSDQIDLLIGKLMDEWVGTADAIVERLNKGSAQVQAAINEIKKDIDIAKNVVKGLGALDEAIGVAKTVLAAGVI